MTLLEMAMSLAVVGLLLVVVAGVAQSIRQSQRPPEVAVQQLMQEMLADFLLKGRFAQPANGRADGALWVGDLPGEALSGAQGKDLVYAVHGDLLNRVTTRLAGFNKLGEAATAPGRPTALMAAAPMNLVVEQCVQLFGLANAALTSPAQPLVVRVYKRDSAPNSSLVDQGFTALDRERPVPPS